MRSRRGAALLLVLLVLLVATAASVMALQWATLQLQVGRAWRRALRAEAAVHAEAVQLLRSPSPGNRVSSWPLTDGVVLIRVGAALAGPAIEIVARPPAKAGTDSVGWLPLGVRGLLPLH